MRQPEQTATRRIRRFYELSNHEVVRLEKNSSEFYELSNHTRSLLMQLFGFHLTRQPDIKVMKEAHDINGLISLSDHGNFDIQWRAADALTCTIQKGYNFF